MPASLTRAGSLGALLLVVLGVAASPAASATLLVSPAGTDTGGCRTAPCASLAYAYERSGAGDVVSVAAGTYPPQTVPVGTKQVTFRAAPGNKVRKLDNYASNVTFDGFDVDANMTTPDSAVFENHADPEARNVTFRNGRIGNVVDQKGAVLGGWSSTASLNLLIDNVVFHDVVQQTDGVHNECIFSETPGLTIRNSTFTDCATMDLFVLRGDWWGQPPYGDLTLENNVFGHTVNGSGWHYYGLYWSNDAFKDVRVVNNTFENSVILDNVGGGPYSGVWANNIGGGWDCLPGVTFRNNLGTKCDGSDTALTPSSSCAPPACGSPSTVPVGWADPAAGDFHLTAGSPAIGAASAAYAPAGDRDCRRRDAHPDAGAYEYGATGDACSGGQGTPPPGGSGGSPSPGGGEAAAVLAPPAIRTARPRPAVICRRARAHCPSSARVVLALTRAAQASIRISRLRPPRRARRVRSLTTRSSLSPTARIKARGLRRGRYRVTIVAVDASGSRSAARTLKLRVR